MAIDGINQVARAVAIDAVISEEPSALVQPAQ